MPAVFEWTEDVEERLCEAIAGGMGINEATREDGMPSQPTVYRRMAADEEFAHRISVARAAQQDAEVEKCVELADMATPEDWQVVKLQIWARQWRAAKLAPKKYGEKITAAHTGPNGGPIETTTTHKLDTSSMTEEQLRVLASIQVP